MVPFFSARYVDTFGVFDVNRAIPVLIHGSELVAVAQGAGGILGLSVDFLGSTTRSQNSEHVTTCAIAVRCRWSQSRGGTAGSH